jgi:trk system potassium uptake protein TrkH
MIVPVLFALADNDMGSALGILTASMFSGFVGAALWFSSRGLGGDLGKREAYLLLILTWPLLAALSATPMMFGNPSVSIINALFDSVSGLTTTGMSAVPNIGDLPRSLLIWRSLMEWSGGFLTVLFALVLLSHLSLGGMELVVNALPKGEGDTLPQRLAQSASDLLWIYLLLTLIGGIALWALGMPAFDAARMAMAALSTGGFVADEGNGAALYGWPVRFAISILLLFGMTNLSLHGALLRRRSGLYRMHRESSYMLLTMAIVILGTGALVWFISGKYGLPTTILRTAEETFWVLSTSGIGVSQGRLEFLPPILVMAMLVVGGCSGSTAGGLKFFRAAVLFKQAKRELARLSHPHGVLPLTAGDQNLENSTIRGVWGFFFVSLGIVAVVALILAGSGMTLAQALAYTLAAVVNAGPMVHAIAGDAPVAYLLDWGQKLCLMLAMLLGRMEFLVLLILFNRSYWRP